jgi:hypothetical protein
MHGWGYADGNSDLPAWSNFLWGSARAYSDSN